MKKIKYTSEEKQIIEDFGHHYIETRVDNFIRPEESYESFNF